MAKILGESGRYVSDEAVRQRERILNTAFVMIGLPTANPRHKSALTPKSHPWSMAHYDTHCHTIPSPWVWRRREC